MATQKAEEEQREEGGEESEEEEEGETEDEDDAAGSDGQDPVDGNSQDGSSPDFDQDKDAPTFRRSAAPSPPLDRTLELIQRVESLSLDNPPDNPKPDTAAHGEENVPSTEKLNLSEDDTTVPAPAPGSYLKHIVSSEVSRDHARQHSRYHSGKKMGAGRSKGSKAKLDTRIKMDKSGVWD